MLISGAFGGRAPVSLLVGKLTLHDPPDGADAVPGLLGDLREGEALRGEAMDGLPSLVQDRNAAAAPCVWRYPRRQSPGAGSGIGMGLPASRSGSGEAWAAGAREPGAGPQRGTTVLEPGRPVPAVSVSYRERVATGRRLEPHQVST